MPQATRYAALALLLVSSVAPSSFATLRTELPYSREQLFSCALRYLRVDLGSEISEKDDTAAYLLFKYQAPDQKTATPGSVELVQRAAGTTLVVRLPRLPSYYETLLRDGLVRKLQEDYGLDKPRRAPKPAPAEDADKSPTPPAEAKD